MAPRSLIVRMPILIPFPLIAAPLPPLTALYRPLRPLPPSTALYRPLPPGPMRHERQLHHLRRHALAADVDLELGAGVRQRPRHVGHADGRIDGGGNGAAAHHVHLAAVARRPAPGTGIALR